MYTQNPRDMRDILLDFVNARTWAKSKRILEEHQDVLLTDTAEKLFLELVEEQHDEGPIHTLKEHQTIIRQARAEGIDAAFMRFLRPSSETSARCGGPPPDVELPPIPLKLREQLESVRNPEDLHHLMDEEPDVVPMMAQMMEMAAQYHPGIALGMCLQTWMQIPTLLEQKTYLQEHPEMLTDEAERIFSGLIQSADLQDDDEVVDMLMDHRNLLRQARAKGIDAAFSERGL